eukprot:6471722-Amphidinium_carterae.1
MVPSFQAFAFVSDEARAGYMRLGTILRSVQHTWCTSFGKSKTCCCVLRSVHSDRTYTIWLPATTSAVKLTLRHCKSENGTQAAMPLTLDYQYRVNLLNADDESLWQHMAGTAAPLTGSLAGILTIACEGQMPPH